MELLHDKARLDSPKPRRALAMGLVVWMLGGCVTLAPQPKPELAPPDDAAEPIGPCSVLSPRELEKQAIELLDIGDIETARRQLDCALELNPTSPKARSLVKQLDVDPVGHLGAVSYSYVVQNNETLSKIAKQRLGSSLQFMILARYNNIDVPANLRTGQTIRIPGVKPAESFSPEESNYQPDEAVDVDRENSTTPDTNAGGLSAAALTNEALSKEDEGDLQGAYQLITRAHETDPSAEGVDRDLARIKSALIGKLEEQAYSHELSGAPQNAVDTWKAVLAIDPSNIPAQLSIKRLNTQLPSSP